MAVDGTSLGMNKLDPIGNKWSRPHREHALEYSDAAVSNATSAGTKLVCSQTKFSHFVFYG